MKLRITYYLTILLLVAGWQSRAQQLPLFSQYLFNGFLINPAYAGLNGYNSANLTAREQWLGLPNAPKTHIVSFQTRLLGNSFIKRSSAARRKSNRLNSSGRVGIGGFIYNDRNGHVNRTGAQFTYAYHIRVQKGTTLSMAGSGSIFQFSIPRDKLKTEHTRDLLLDNSALNMWIPDVNLGFVYSTPTYYVGFAADQLLQAYLKLGDNIDEDYRLYRHYNLTGGYRYEIDRITAVEPSFLVKATQQLSYQVDITTRVYYDQYWAGLGFRTGSVAAIAMFGMKVDKFLFGYSFDYNFKGINGTFGSHEFMVAFRWGDSPSRLRWLNR